MLLSSAQVPLLLKLGPLTAITIGLGTLARGGRGTSYRKSKLPDKPIDIWGERMHAFLPLCQLLGFIPWVPSLCPRRHNPLVGTCGFRVGWFLWVHQVVAWLGASLHVGTDIIGPICRALQVPDVVCHRARRV